MPVDYQKGQIYFIRSHQTEKVYVGSTTQKLSVRLAGHKRDFKRYKNGKKNYITVFDLLEVGDVYIEWQEDFPCNSKKELEAREGYWIRKEDCVNKLIAGRTPKEWCDDNKDKVSGYQKVYYTKNREKRLEYNKKWQENNRERRLQYHKEYDKNRRVKGEPKKVECGCGRVVCRDHIKRHKKSKIHKKWVESQASEEPEIIFLEN